MINGVSEFFNIILVAALNKYRTRSMINGVGEFFDIIFVAALNKYRTGSMINGVLALDKYRTR
jgi:hypothetical protein